MVYIPQSSLENLKKYSYKGIDKSVSSVDPDVLIPTLFSHIGHCFRVMFWTRIGPGSLLFGRCRWRLTQSVITKLFGTISGELTFIIIDHADRLSSCSLQLFYHALLWSNVSYAKRGCGRSPTLGVLYVCQSVFAFIPGFTHSRLSRRWAIGLFTYQSLDAIDGYVSSDFKNIFAYLMNITKEASEKDGNGWSAWRNVRSWYSYSVFDFSSSSDLLL